ncbi:MAG: TlpA family protein disulfide reductase [Kofleriaceae bacterium]|nr:TlpA family protein disulfide reductase [Kofleriaceae bacterium]
MSPRALLVVALAASGACARWRPGPVRGAGRRGGGDRAAGPPLILTLAAVDGGEIALAEHRGKVVVLHVFTTWSLAAHAELDGLRAADALPDVVVIGLALDPEGRLLVAPWRAAADVGYLIALADDAVRAGHGPLGRLAAVPMTIVLDASGRVFRRLERPLAEGELAPIVAAARRQ